MNEPKRPEDAGDDELRKLLLEAEQRLAGIPALELRIADLEYELAETRKADEAAREEVRSLTERLTRAQRNLIEVTTSPSWKLTRPLRDAKRLLNR